MKKAPPAFIVWITRTAWPVARAATGMRISFIGWPPLIKNRMPIARSFGDTSALDLLAQMQQISKEQTSRPALIVAVRRKELW
jgi:hypothetical protein